MPISILNRTFKPKTLFLIDGIGALVSAFMLGIVLANFSELIGLSTILLYGLAFIPILFAIYSFSCYFFLKNNWKSYLQKIGYANLMYCCLTFGIMISAYQKLTILGYAYFIGEIIILLILIRIEFSTALS